jgi:large subunit ribosomal protein L19
MIRSAFQRAANALFSCGSAATAPTARVSSNFSVRSFASNNNKKYTRRRPQVLETPMDVAEMPFLHHGTRPRFRDYVKFKSPRKTASKLLHDITNEAVQKSKQARPKVWRDFCVGDALEVKIVASGGVKSHSLEKIRGVVLGIYRRGLDSTVLLRDVVFGVPLERRVPLHSPLVRSIKVLESNFAYKNRRKVKRAKLYFLRDRNPLGTSWSMVGMSQLTARYGLVLPGSYVLPFLSCHVYTQTPRLLFQKRG